MDKNLLSKINPERIFFVSHAGHERIASGLVSVISPIINTFGGTWVSVAAESPENQNQEKINHKIIKVLIDRKELRDYYEGFCNQGLWPLCHGFINAPALNATCFQAYESVNKKFALAIAKNLSGKKKPIIFIHDYHLGLLPKFLKNLVPDAVIIYFWHIPWPVSSKLNECLEINKIIQSILISNNIGFQTKNDVKNFLDAVNKVDKKNSAKSNPHIGHYPATVDWPEVVNEYKRPSFYFEAVRTLHNIRNDTILGLGVDRFDYSKGLIEKFDAIEAYFDAHPEIHGKLIFIQVCIPTRASIQVFSEYEFSVRRSIERINNKFKYLEQAPIILITKTLEKQALDFYYKAANFLLVSSIHDGMNLVAKEFVSARNDEMGVLFLSKYAGCSEELKDAISFDPKNISSCVKALTYGLHMSTLEINTRMHSMRRTLQKHTPREWIDNQLQDVLACI